MITQELKQIESIKTICHRCKHEWIFRGIKLSHLGKYPVYAQCPNCRTSIRIKEKEENKK